MLSSRRFRLPHPALLLLTLLAPSPTLAQTPAPDFTITGENITISRTGSGAIPYTLSSVNGFTGSVAVVCDPPPESLSVNIPVCGAGPVFAYPVSSGQVIQGSFTLYSRGTPMPASAIATENPALAILLCLALLCPLALRRKQLSGWLNLPVLLVAATLLAVSAGCGSGPQGYTPGTYSYLLTASQTGSQTPLQHSATATLTIQ